MDKVVNKQKSPAPPEPREPVPANSEVHANSMTSCSNSTPNPGPEPREPAAREAAEEIENAYHKWRTSGPIWTKYGCAHTREREITTEFAEAYSAELRAAKDGAYAERDNLVAALSKLFPSALERHPDSDTTWENDWRWVVFIDLPTGQATWHIHDSELAMFDHLPRFTGRIWDRHTTPQKYLRLAALASTSAPEGTV